VGDRQAFFWAFLPLIFSCEQHLAGAFAGIMILAFKIEGRMTLYLLVSIS
jgi:hypothetical protein